MTRDQRGFTLIEVMIAVTLVAAISTTMLFAIRTALITLQKTDDRLMSNRRVMSVERILGNQLGGVMPVIFASSILSLGTPASIAFAMPPSASTSWIWPQALAARSWVSRST